MDYLFTLKYSLPADEIDMDALVERLGEAGCDDATAGIGVPGRLALAFSREAPSAADAIGSAMDDVRRVMPAATLIEVSPDVVGLTEIAECAGVSRQNMRKLMLAHAGRFPAPLHDGSSALWHLSDVLAWLAARKGYTPDAAVMETALAAMQVNIAKEHARVASLDTVPGL